MILNHATAMPTVTINDVAARFEQWRATKKLGDKIPTELWDLARSLKQRYKISHIGRSLQVSFSQLRREGVAPPAKPRKRQSPESKKFVSVQLDSALPALGNALQPTLVFKRPDGTQLSLSQPSTEQLNLFIQSFME